MIKSLVLHRLQPFFRKIKCSDFALELNMQQFNTVKHFPNYQNLKTRDKIYLEQNIKFHFLLSSTVYYEGVLWEIAIKGPKYHLTRIIGEQKLTLMDFITLTTRIKAILNSQIFVPLSNDPSELRILTLGHFLTGQELITLSEENLSDLTQNYF